jgi:hypothetical protein
MTPASAITLPDEVLAKAPRIWRKNGVGVAVRVMDPRWLRKQEEMFAKRQALKKLAPIAPVIVEEVEPAVWEPGKMSAYQFLQYQHAYQIAVRAGLIPGCHEAKGPISAVLKAVAAKYGLDVEQIRHKNGKHVIVRARHEVMWIARTKYQLSFPAIARLMGVIDHTSVIHGVKAHEQRLETGEATR